MIYMLALVDKKWHTGKDGKPIIKIPDDLKTFRAVTHGQAVIMDENSYAQMTQGRRLPERVFVIADESASADDIIKEASKNGSDIYICGGSFLVEKLLSRCDGAFITYVDYTYDANDSFPNLDKSPEWVLVEESEEQTYFDTVYYLRRYLRRKDFIK